MLPAPHHRNTFKEDLGLEEVARAELLHAAAALAFAAGDDS